MKASASSILTSSVLSLMLILIAVGCSTPQSQVPSATPTKSVPPTVVIVPPTPTAPIAPETASDQPLDAQPADLQSTEDQITATKIEALPVPGTSAIFLAGRTDLTIPKPGEEIGEFPIANCGGNLTVTFPVAIPIPNSRQSTFEVSGKVDFYGAEKPELEPDGDPGATADIEGLGGISGYKGQCGTLVGVFLTDANPSTEERPDTIDFTDGGLSRAFKTLNPGLRQVFFIGDGMTTDDEGKPVQQIFKAPDGATRLFVGIADAPLFNGAPGCYEDNVGQFEVKVL